MVATYPEEMEEVARILQFTPAVAWVVVVTLVVVQDHTTECECVWFLPSLVVSLCIIFWFCLWDILLVGKKTVSPLSSSKQEL
jgi:hypothetical protein